MTAERETLLWATNQALHRFASVFVIPDNHFTFELVFWPPSITPKHAAVTYFESNIDPYRAAYFKNKKEYNWQFGLTFLQKGNEEVRTALNDWLMQPFDLVLKKIPLPHFIGMNQPPSGFIIESIERMGATGRFWRLDIHHPIGEGLRPWYEAAWDDFVIEIEDGFLFLHLGVSD